jgi:two-component system, NarL family, nitrate/nitrite response regulator NarL
MISVLLVDDQVSVTKSLQSLLETTEDIYVAATASNGIEAVAQARLHCPDVAVVDISMPLMDGIETTRQLRELCRLTRVLMFSIYDNPEYIQRSLEVGAVGFVLKESIGQDLLKAVRAAYQGKRYFSRKIAEIAEKFMSQKGHDSWAG